METQQDWCRDDVVCSCRTSRPAVGDMCQVSTGQQLSFVRHHRRCRSRCRRCRPSCLFLIMIVILFSFFFFFAGAVCLLVFVRLRMCSLISPAVLDQDV